MSRLIMVVITFAIILILYVGVGGSSKAAKPANQHASQQSSASNPNDGFAGGLQGTLDQKDKLGLQFRFDAQLSSLRLALSNPLDNPGKAAALAEQDQLVKDVRTAKQNLMAGGTPPTVIDNWLATTAWPQCKKLADQLRKQMAQDASSDDNPDK